MEQRCGGYNCGRGGDTRKRAMETRRTVIEDLLVEGKQGGFQGMGGRLEAERVQVSSITSAPRLEARAPRMLDLSPGNCYISSHPT